MTYETFGLAPGLEQLVAVADTGSITAAAARLGVPQPTVSRALARLAGDLGTDLLVREGRGIRLTRQGTTLAEAGRAALRELRGGIDEVRVDADETAGRVVLGFLHSMGPRAVPELLRGFRAEHPGVRIALVQDAAGTVLDAVVAGRVDLALASPVPPRPELGRRTLARQPLVAVVPRGHRLAARGRVRPADLAGDPVVTMRPGYGVRTITDALLREAGVPRAYEFETDEMTTIAGLVEAGFGVSILPRGAAAGADVVELTLAGRDAARTISLAWPARRTLTAPVAALRRHLLAHGPAALATA